MKIIPSYMLVLLLLLSCNSEPIDPYELPWNTKYITYENFDMLCDNHSAGFKVYYKDSLLMQECVELGGIRIVNSLCVNDSILYLVKSSGAGGSSVLFTKNGGVTWNSVYTGPPALLKMHFVTSELVYFITNNSNDIYFTGIEKSDLSLYKSTLAKGIHYITDLGTSIDDLDSTVIKINDTIEYRVLFY